MPNKSFVSLQIDLLWKILDMVVETKVQKRYFFLNEEMTQEKFFAEAKALAVVSFNTPKSSGTTKSKAKSQHGSSVSKSDFLSIVHRKQICRKVKSVVRSLTVLISNAYIRMHTRNPSLWMSRNVPARPRPEWQISVKPCLVFCIIVLLSYIWGKLRGTAFSPRGNQDSIFFQDSILPT